MIATPPANFANLSCNFSLSYDESLDSICLLICSHLDRTSFSFPSAMIVVFYFVTVTLLACPNMSNCKESRLNPASSEIT